jgi:hypothetical protein
MERSGGVRESMETEAERDARSQLAGMAVMLTVTRGYLPDEVLWDLIQRLGGPTVYVDGILSVAFSLAELPLKESLLQGARDVLRRLRRLSSDLSPS